MIDEKLGQKQCSKCVERIKLSGKVEDYLRYAEINTVGGGETASADADRGTDNQVPRYQ